MSEKRLKKYSALLRNADNPILKKTVIVYGINEEDARERAESGGWDVLSVSEKGGASFFTKLALMGESNKGLAEKDVVRFCKGLAIMIRSGIGIVEGIRFYAENLGDRNMARILVGVAEEIKNGTDPDRAFADTGKFSDLFIGMVKAGVESGGLADALDSISHQMRMMSSFATRMKRMLTTPCVILVVLVAMFIAAQLIITPRIEEMLNSNKVEPDFFSSIIFAMSHFIQAVWWMLPIGVGAIVLLMAARKEFRVALIGLAMSKWALLRTLVMSMRQHRFIGTLSMLVNNGIPLDQALVICQMVVKGGEMEREIIKVTEQYSSGIPLGTCFRRYTSCESAVVHMVELGQETELAPQLKNCSDMLEEQTEEAMTDFSAFTGVISVLIPAMVIGFLFITSYLPIVLMSARMMQGFASK